jgi:hypothetical protein
VNKRTHKHSQHAPAMLTSAIHRLSTSHLTARDATKQRALRGASLCRRCRTPCSPLRASHPPCHAQVHTKRNCAPHRCAGGFRQLQRIHRRHRLLRALHVTHTAHARYRPTIGVVSCPGIESDRLRAGDDFGDVLGDVRDVVRRTPSNRALRNAMCATVSNAIAHVLCARTPCHRQSLL